MAKAGHGGQGPTATGKEGKDATNEKGEAPSKETYVTGVSAVVSKEGKVTRPIKGMGRGTRKPAGHVPVTISSSPRPANNNS